MSEHNNSRQLSVQTVSIDDLQNNPHDPRASRDRKYVNELTKSIDHEGLLMPLLLDEDLTIVDGHYRREALQQLGVEALEVFQVQEGKLYAVTTEEAKHDLGISSMAANVVRQQASNAESARFLTQMIQERVVDELPQNELEELENTGSDDASACVKILNHMENVERRDTEWKFSRGYESLQRILSATNYTARGARDLPENYQKAKENAPDVLEAWMDQRIESKSAVEALRLIDDDSVRSSLLQSAIEEPDEYSANRLGKISRIVRMDVEPVTQALLEKLLSYPEARELAEKALETEADNATIQRWIQSPDKPQDNEKRSDSHSESSSTHPKKNEKKRADQPPKEESTKGNAGDLIPEECDPTNTDANWKEFRSQMNENELELASTIASETGQPIKDVIRDCLRQHQNGDNYANLLKSAATEAKKMGKERRTERTQNVGDYNFDKSPFACQTDDGTNVHQEAPIVLNPDGDDLNPDDGFTLDDLEVATFFHDNVHLDLEIPNDYIHLFFFSPPYFDQSGTMPIDEWLPENIDTISKDDEDILDETYDNYLNWLIDRIRVFTSKLRDGRAMIINVSDIVPKLEELDEGRFGNAPKKRYDIPAALSYRAPREVEDLTYDSTIQWVRKETTSNRGGQYWSETEGKSGYPLYYYPQDATEELLIFRKGGKPDHRQVIDEAKDRFDREFSTDAEFRSCVSVGDPQTPFIRHLDEVKGETQLDKHNIKYDHYSLECGFDNPRKNVWKIEPQTDDWSHQTAFPRKLARLVIELYTLPGECVADPFGGYGTTLRAVQGANTSRPNMPYRQGYCWENFGSECTVKDDFKENIMNILSKKGLSGFGQPLRVYDSSESTS